VIGGKVLRLDLQLFFGQLPVKSASDTRRDLGIGILAQQADQQPWTDECQSKLPKKTGCICRGERTSAAESITLAGLFGYSCSTPWSANAANATICGPLRGGSASAMDIDPHEKASKTMHLKNIQVTFSPAGSKQAFSIRPWFATCYIVCNTASAEDLDGVEMTSSQWFPENQE
jgi:hypothetical protein